MKKLSVLSFALVLSLQLLAQTQSLPYYIPQSGLIAYFPFSGNANDLSGNGLDGQVEGALLTSDRNGNDSSAYVFNGTGDRIFVEHNEMLDFQASGEFTVSFWLNGTPNASRVDHIVSKQTGSGSNQVGWNCSFQQNTSEPTLIIRNGVNSNQCISSSGQTITPEQWQHITMSRSDSTQKIYINGQLVSEFDCSTEIGDNTNSLQIGSNDWATTFPNVQSFVGAIDDLAIHNRALTDLEIDFIYQSDEENGILVCNNLPQGIAPLTGGWEFHDLIVPEGFQIDSIYADFSRPGFSEAEMDYAFSYTGGLDVYNSNFQEEYFNYLDINTSMYDQWIDLSTENIFGPGVARIIAPTNNAVVWDDFCYSLSESVCVTPNPCTFNYSQGDFNCDGEVNSADLLQFLSNFGLLVTP